MMPGAVSAQSLGESQALALARSPAALAKVNAGEFRKSAEIVKDDRLCLALARTILRDHAEEAIRGAFPAHSRHQTCKDAARACGISPDSVLRLMEGEVGSPDAMILGHYARLYTKRTGKVSPISVVLAQIIAAETKA